MNFKDFDAQGKWEFTALNALEQACQANAVVCQVISDSLKKPCDTPEELIPLSAVTLAWVVAFLSETQKRISRDLLEMRKLTVQRLKEQK